MLRNYKNRLSSRKCTPNSSNTETLESIDCNDEVPKSKDKSLCKINLEIKTLDYKPLHGKSRRDLYVPERKQKLLVKLISSEAKLVRNHKFESLKKIEKYNATDIMKYPKEYQVESKDLYKRVTIFNNMDKRMPVDVERVKISSLDMIAREGFQGIKELNIIQSTIFEAAYNGDENLLIAAPTGAGKTNIAMLTVLHEIKKHVDVSGKLHLKKFKIIYIAAMKALASEMTTSFRYKLRNLDVNVKECTGDMKLTKKEIDQTQIMVMTPEKYDVLTRKGAETNSFLNIVRLIIIDEVHLLNEDRGSVIEAIVSRTLRQVERSKCDVRIVALSATLPNYIDVAKFLHVNLETGLYYFDGRYRPVQLQQTVYGIKSAKKEEKDSIMNFICYERMLESVREGKQVMVFVNGRNQTWETADYLQGKVAENGLSNDFIIIESSESVLTIQKDEELKDRNLVRLFKNGFGIHHAGMMRCDRNFVEEQFLAGNIKVLCCTATLAWGVNLPAHTVIIKGTTVYDSEQSKYVDLGILDILQIFGRAGRPQFDVFGHGILVTEDKKMNLYIELLSEQLPIESQFLHDINDHLNAEIVLGSVTSVQEAIKWLEYTFLYVRMKINPVLYGSTNEELVLDPNLYNVRRTIIDLSMRDLEEAKMIRFDDFTEIISSTDSGKLSSHFYIKYATARYVEEKLKPHFEFEDIFTMISNCDAFSKMKERKEETNELENLSCKLKYCPPEVSQTKANILIQCYIDRCDLKEISLNADLSYIYQNAPRISRYLFEIALNRRWAKLSRKLLDLTKMIDKKLWSHYTPLWQFEEEFPDATILKLIDANELSILDLRQKTTRELSRIFNNGDCPTIIKQLINSLPLAKAVIMAEPMRGSMFRVHLKIEGNFTWISKYHGTETQSFWLAIEDEENDCICHSQYIKMSKEMVESGEWINVSITFPGLQNVSNSYTLRIVSESWIGPAYIGYTNFNKIH